MNKPKIINKNKNNNMRLTKLETYVLQFQEASNRNDKNGMEYAYRKIYEIYPALNYLHTWYKQYSFLYDSVEDFKNEYMIVFLKSLHNWKPRHLRGQSKYNGQGTFKNFFWQCLKNNFSNEVKTQNTQKRSIPQKCPICYKIAPSLATHVLSHDEIIMSVLKKVNKGQDIEKCPFCNYFKYKAYQEDKTLLINKLKIHLQKSHSNKIFDEFKEQYPEYVNLVIKPISINILYDDAKDNNLDLYEIIKTEPKLEDLYSLDLSAVQHKIVENILDENKSDYDPNLYNCTEAQFNIELNDLKNKLILCGIERI